MNVNHSTKRNQTHKRIIWNQGKTLIDRILQLVQIFLIQTSIYDIKKHGRTCLSTRKLVLDCRKVRNQFCWKICLRNVLCVVWRKMISLQRERTRPKLASKIYLTERIQNTSRTFTSYRMIWLRLVLNRFQRCEPVL